MAVNIKTNSLFAVKKLQFMTSTGVDKEAIVKLRVRTFKIDLTLLERD